jgi:prevent-host-death family protein
MTLKLRALEDLPRHNATHVKNKWGDVVRQVHKSGSVAITNHANIEMVLLDAATYEQLVGHAAALKQKEQSVLDDLHKQFDAELAVLQHADANQKVDALFEAKGKTKQRPKAGASF